MRTGLLICPPPGTCGQLRAALEVYDRRISQITEAAMKEEPIVLPAEYWNFERLFNITQGMLHRKEAGEIAFIRSREAGKERA